MAEPTEPTNDPAASQMEFPDPQRPAASTPSEPQLEQETPGGSRSAGHDPYAAFRVPGYIFYLLGYTSSIIGQQVQSVAVGWHLSLRASIGRADGGRAAALALGMVGLVQAVPVILLAIPAGQLADKYDRRLVTMCSQLAAALCSLGLALVSHHDGSPALIYLFLGLGASAQAVGWPARSALLPQIVPSHIFPNAATWNSSGNQIASVVGPAIGGIVVAFTITGAYLLDATCALGFFTFLMLLRPQAVAPTREPASLKTLLAGIRFVWSTKIILATITLDLFAVLLGGAVYLVPIYAKEILHVGPVGFGWLKAAPAVGALAVALTIAHLPPMRRPGAAMLWAVGGFGVATIVFGLSQSIVLSFLMLAATGGFDNISVVVRHTLVQMLPPENMRGRVSAVNNVFIGASNEIGGFESGLTAKLFGPVASVVGGGIGTVLVVLGIAMLWPEVRRLGPLESLHAPNLAPIGAGGA